MPDPATSPDLWIAEYHTPWDCYAHGITEVLVHKQTPYQTMLLVKTGAYGKGLVLDGKWQSTVADEFLYHEPLIHPACLQHGSPRTVLILGGAEGASIREALRWHSVERVVMVDIDPDVVEACRQYLPEMHQQAFDDPRTEVVIADAAEYLDQTQIHWDVIIADLSDPIEAGPASQLFTREFFQRIRQVLAPTGAFALQAGSVSPVEIRLHAGVIRTLRTVFPHVHAYSSYAPTYGSPLGLALCSSKVIPTRPEPDAIDHILAQQTQGGFQMFDGITFLGLMQTPAHIRAAIAAEQWIYTWVEPPQTPR